MKVSSVVMLGMTVAMFAALLSDQIVLGMACAGIGVIALIVSQWNEPGTKLLTGILAASLLAMLLVI